MVATVRAERLEAPRPRLDRLEAPRPPLERRVVLLRAMWARHDLDGRERDAGR
jgi:hypothetical protein